MFLAAYMAILLRCDRRPALAWALPPIQVLWVNSHGLFVLGLLILASYVADLALRTSGGASRRVDGRSGGSPPMGSHRACLGRGADRLPGQPLRL